MWSGSDKTLTEFTQMVDHVCNLTEFHFMYIGFTRVYNRQIFPHHNGASTNSRKSRNKLSAQRAAREESVPL